MFFDNEEEKKVKGCDFCRQERRWIEKVRELRVPCECLVLAQKQVEIKEHYRRKFQEELQKSKTWQSRPRNESAYSRALREKIARVHLGLCGAKQSLLPALCNGCNNGALELHQEYAAYSFADDWRRGLMFSSETESRSHEMVIATMRNLVAETRRNWELVNKMNEELRDALFHLTEFFEQPVYVPEGC